MNLTVDIWYPNDVHVQRRGGKAGEAGEAIVHLGTTGPGGEVRIFGDIDRLAVLFRDAAQALEELVDRGGSEP